jgi:hypothetical protein
MSTILAGLQVTPPLPGGDAGANIEALSSVTRTLRFRLTVRDNSPYVSGVKIPQTQFTDTTVTVTNTSGPFQVTAPNTNVSWAGNSSQTITWDVANTTLPPVDTANVKISLSTDGGNTFPHILAGNTPNDGTETVTIPRAPTTQGRIKIEAVGNIYFDISNADFAITGPAALAVSQAFSRKTHTQAGAFNLPLPTTGNAGVESRTGGPSGDHTIVFTFTNPLVSGNASVTSGSGSVAGSPTISGNTMTVNLTGVADAQRTTVTLTNVSDNTSQTLPTTAITIGFLVGDSNGDGIVNAADTLQTRGRSGQGTDGNNFRSDVNLDGAVNSGDATIVRSRSGNSLP